MHSIITTFRGAVIKVEVANFCAAMDTLIDQDGISDAAVGSHLHLSQNSSFEVEFKENLYEKYS